nr:MAG TPA: RNA polymerase sigma factor [Caudoviricetes sp.]
MQATQQSAETNAAAQAVQDGKEDILVLWLACRQYVMRQARRWYRAFEGRRGVDLDDLEQAGFLALARSVETWKPESSAFSTWLTFHLKSAFAAAYRVRTNHERKDPLNNAISLDVPPAGADEDCLLRDIIPDAAAALAFEAVEQQELCEAVQNALAKLPEEQQAAIYGEFWQSKTADPKIRRAAIKALRNPAISRPLRSFR